MGGTGKDNSWEFYFYPWNIRNLRWLAAYWTTNLSLLQVKSQSFSFSVTYDKKQKLFISDKALKLIRASATMCYVQLYITLIILIGDFIVDW